MNDTNRFINMNLNIISLIRLTSNDNWLLLSKDLFQFLLIIWKDVSSFVIPVSSCILSGNNNYSLELNTSEAVQSWWNSIKHTSRQPYLSFGLITLELCCFESLSFVKTFIILLYYTKYIRQVILITDSFLLN